MMASYGSNAKKEIVFWHFFAFLSLRSKIFSTGGKSTGVPRRAVL